MNALTTENELTTEALPPVYDSVIPEETAAQLFADIEACTSVVDIQIKPGREQWAQLEAVSLEEARRQLFAGAVFGVHIRYLYEGALGRDVIFRQANGYRVVRIETPA